MKSGDSVNTCYGAGILDRYREVDSIYVVELPFGVLYGPKSAVFLDKKEQDDDDDENKNDVDSSIMELNVAYEALERMRKLNLEVTCQEAGIPCVDFDVCKTCLLSSQAPSPQPQQQPQSSIDKNTTRASKFASRMMSTTTKARLAALKQRIPLKKKKKSPPCLICGTPVCRQHASASFRKTDGIVMCGDCEALFGMDYVVTVLTCPDARRRRQHVDRMLELYDRAVLLLKYSAACHIPDLCTALEQGTVRQNRVGLGSSSAGIVSGVLGIVSAATILTPAGPPLLMASLLFGGGATVTQTGSEVSAHYSAPNQLANKILALHGLALNILRVTGTLRDALLRDYVRRDMYQKQQSSGENNDDDDEKLLLLLNQKDARLDDVLSKNPTGLLASATTIGSVTLSRASLVATMEAGQAVNAAEAGVLVSSNARFVSRGSTAAMRSMRFARFAGGTLAAATLVLEAKSLQNTLQSVQAGSPCAKAEALRRIAVEITALPETRALDAECESYLQALTSRLRALSQEEVARLLQEQHEELLEEAAQQEELLKLKEEAQQLAALHEEDESSPPSLSTTAASSLNEVSLNNMDATANNTSSTKPNTKTSSTTTASRRRRFVRSNSSDSHSSAKSTASTLSLRERIERHKQREQSSSPPQVAETTAAETEVGIQLTS